MLAVSIDRPSSNNDWCKKSDKELEEWNRYRETEREKEKERGSSS